MANFFKFPSEQIFATKAAELISNDQVLNWLDVDKTKIYRIKEIKQRVSQKYGECWLLHLVDEEENLVKVWGPRKLIHELKESRKSFQTPFIRSLGQERIGTKTFNQYSLCYEDQQQPYPLFESDAVVCADDGGMDDTELANAILNI